MRSHADICTAKYRAKYGRFRYSHQSRRTFGYHCRCCLWNAGTFTRHLRFPTLEVLLILSLLLLYNLELFCRSLCSIFQHLKVSRKIVGEENKESKEEGSWVFSFQVFWWIFRTYLSSPKLTLLEEKVGPKIFLGVIWRGNWMVALSITLVNWERLKSEAANFFHQSLVKPEAHKLAFVTSKLVGFY